MTAKERLEQALKAARDICAKAEGENRDLTAEERTGVMSALEDAKSARVDLEAERSTADLKAAVDALGEGLGLKTATDEPRLVVPGAREAKALGATVTEAPEFKAWLESVAPGGRVSEKAALTSPAVQVGGLKALRKAIVAGGDPGGAGALVQPQNLGLLVPFIGRPLTLRDLVTPGDTDSDTVTYARQIAVANAAAPVPEARGSAAGDQVGDVVGRKPESGFTLDTITEPVRTIAHWLPATRRALTDAGQLRTLIDNFLLTGLEETLETEMLTGDGTGEHFDGILNTPGTVVMPADPGGPVITARRARTRVRTVGRSTPTAYLLNPLDWESIQLTRENGANGAFMFGGPSETAQPRMWGLPVVESEGVPAGTGIVADFRTCVLWDREDATIQVSDSHADFFIRNLVAILAELRAAFGILRPSAIVEFPTAAA